MGTAGHELVFGLVPMLSFAAYGPAFLLPDKVGAIGDLVMGGKLESILFV
jgi:hypothetical protein